MVIGKPFLTVEQIQDKVRELATKISEDYKGKELLTIGILRGAFMFFSDIVRFIQSPMSIDFLIASSYVKTQSTGEIKIHADLREEITNRHVIIIEDIVSSKKMTYLDAISYYCEETKMEPQTVGKLVQGSLKDKLREEVTALHYHPKTATIPGL